MKRRILLGCLMLGIIASFTYCSSYEEREAKENEEFTKTLLVDPVIDMTAGTAFVPIDFSWDNGNGCYTNRKIETEQTIALFKKKHPCLKIKSWKYDFYTSSSKTLYNGIWVNFEPIEKPVAIIPPKKSKEIDTSGIVETQDGGSLYRTLDITDNDEAKAFAKKWGIPWRNNGALIHPGDRFKFKLVKVWEPVR